MTDKYDAKARDAVESIFKDLRGRRFLKWLFAEDPDAMGPILHDSHGTAVNAICLDAQGEIKAAWVAVISSALRSAAAEEREACAEIAERHQAQHELNQRLASQIGRNVATAIRSRGDSNLVQSDDVPDEVHCDHLMKEKCTIPAGVYWSVEAGNFYDEATNRGMGLDFYDAWQERNEEFPVKATGAPGLDLYLDGKVAPASGDSTGSQDDQRLIETNGGQP